MTFNTVAGIAFISVATIFLFVMMSSINRGVMRYRYRHPWEYEVHKDRIWRNVAKQVFVKYIPLPILMWIIGAVLLAL